MRRIGEAVSSAEVAPAEALPLVGIVQAAQKTIEATDLEQRMAAIEARIREGNLGP